MNTNQRGSAQQRRARRHWLLSEEAGWGGNGNWGYFAGIDNARRWIRSRHWPGVTFVVEEPR